MVLTDLSTKLIAMSLFSIAFGDRDAYPSEQSKSFTLIIASSRPSLFRSYTTGDENPVQPIESMYSTAPSFPFNITSMEPVLLGHWPLLMKVKKSGMLSSVKYPVAKLLLHSVPGKLLVHRT